MKVFYFTAVYWFSDLTANTRLASSRWCPCCPAIWVACRVILILSEDAGDGARRVRSGKRTLGHLLASDLWVRAAADDSGKSVTSRWSRGAKFSLTYMPALPEPTPAHFGCQVPEAFKVKGCCQLPSCNSCGKSRTISPLDGTWCASLMVSVFFTQPFGPMYSLLGWVEEVTERKEMTAKGKQSFPIGKRLPEQSNHSGTNDHMRNADRCQFMSEFVRPPIHLRDTLQTRAL